MKKVNLPLYESHLPPEDINVLWTDIGEGSGNIRDIRKYNKLTLLWESIFLAEGDGGLNSKLVFKYSNAENCTVRICRGKGLVSGRQSETETLVLIAFSELPDEMYTSMDTDSSSHYFLYLKSNGDGDGIVEGNLVIAILLGTLQDPIKNAFSGLAMLSSSLINSTLREKLGNYSEGGTFFYRLAEDFELPKGTNISFDVTFQALIGVLGIICQYPHLDTNV